MPVTRKRIWIELRLCPAHTLPTAAAPVLVGAWLAIHDGIFAAAPGLIALLASWLIHVLTDNHELLRRYPEILEAPDLSAALAQRRRELDALKGRRTLVSRRGIRGRRMVHATLTAFAYLTPLLFPLAFRLRSSVYLPLPKLPWSWQIERTIQSYDDRVELVPMTKAAALLAFAHAVLLGTGLALS